MEAPNHESNCLANEFIFIINFIKNSIKKRSWCVVSYGSSFFMCINYGLNFIFKLLQISVEIFFSLNKNYNVGDLTSSMK